MPTQRFGFGRSDRSSKFTGGLGSKTPTGLWSRRGDGHDRIPITPHNALFASYKTPDFIALEHVGEDGVGLGSDFDGTKVPSEIGTAAGLPNLVEAMRRRGFDEPLTEKVCYKNWLRVLDATWGSAT